MDPTYLPYERPPDPQALWTAIPRGLRGFTVNTGLLDAKPVNDVQLLTLTATLSSSFAYVLADVSLLISQVVAGNWKDSYTLNLQNWYQGQLALATSWMIEFRDGLQDPSAPGASAVEKGNAVGSQNSLPTAPMWAPRGVSGIIIQIQALNVVATVSTAGTVNAFINFWEFDLEQIRKFPINSPIPTHSR